MNKVIYMRTNEGIEIYDGTLQAEERLYEMDCLEKRYRKKKEKSVDGT